MSRHDKVYARCFKDVGKGHAIHRSIPAATMRPGTCGYFDHGGAWVKIFQVAEYDEPTAPSQNSEPVPAAPVTAPVAAPVAEDAAAALDANILTPLTKGRVQLSTPSAPDQWGMKTAGDVSLNVRKATASAKPPPAAGVPIGFSFLAKVRNERRTGAILVTDGNITCHQADPTPVFEEWMEKNLTKILNGDHGRLVRKRGVWIVTRTYTAEKRALAVMQTTNDSREFGADVTVLDIARVGASTAWLRETVNKPGWESHPGPDPVVLFMSGIYWKPRRIGWGLKRKWEQKNKEVLAAGHPLQPFVVTAGTVKDEGGEDGGADPEYLYVTPKVVGEFKDVDERVPRMDFYDYEDVSSSLEESDQH